MTKAFTLLALMLCGACASRHGQGSDIVQGVGIMDSTDSGAGQPSAPRAGRRQLPAIVSLTMERVRVEPPSYKFVRSVQDDAREAVAFTVEVDGELRLDVDATPVLYVGDVELSQIERVGPARYRFLAFPTELKAMRAGAPVSLGWPGHKPHPQTRFYYEPTPR